MLYITSDLHFCHDREFLYKPRGFDNVWDMNKAIVGNWNKIVNPEDDIYVLGDMMLNNDEEGIRLLKSLKGNIHIILGNHDTDNRIELYNKCYNVVEIAHAARLKYNGYHFYLSHYPCLTANYDDDKPLKAKLISLCGHTHTKDKWKDWDKGIIYHCELDAHNNKPISLDCIIEDIKERYYNERGDF